MKSLFSTLKKTAGNTHLFKLLLALPYEVFMSEVLLPYTVTYPLEFTLNNPTPATCSNLPQTI